MKRTLFKDYCRLADRFSKLNNIIREAESRGPFISLDLEDPLPSKEVINVYLKLVWVCVCHV